MPRAPHYFLFALTLPANPGYGAAAKIDFNRDIRPILSENCFVEPASR
ncbi:MAG: hypothetical protein ACREH8_14895 [Opitutaceae bacterium]